MKAGDSELHAVGMPNSRKKLGEASLPHAPNPDLVVLDDEMDVGVRQGLLHLVGQAAQIPGNEPVMLDPLGQVARRGVLSMDESLRRQMRMEDAACPIHDAERQVDDGRVFPIAGVEGWRGIAAIEIIWNAMRQSALSIALLLSQAVAFAAPPAVDLPCRRPGTEDVTSARTLQGTFDIQLTPQPSTPGIEGSGIGRVLLRKRFHGGLEGIGLGEMLAFRTAVPGSAGYVAMERFEGQLNGCSGSFVLMHTGEMSRGNAKLTVQVVTDSGAGGLSGLSGTLSIEAREGKHFYEFSYQLPGK